jgi:uncharacterized protein (DUF1810 family)
MWFVFPQVAGLGASETSRRYAIGSLAEARAYLAHPVLGARLRECAEALAARAGADPVAILGPVDAVKLRSSMTLFELAGTTAGADGDARGEAIFSRVLEDLFAGERDPLTLSALRSRPA